MAPTSAADPIAMSKNDLHAAPPKGRPAPSAMLSTTESADLTS